MQEPQDLCKESEQQDLPSAEAKRAAERARRCGSYGVSRWQTRSQQGVNNAWPNVVVSGRPLRWLIVARCFRPVRSSCSWATAYASVLVGRDEKMQAEAKRW